MYIFNFIKHFILSVKNFTNKKPEDFKIKTTSYKNHFQFTGKERTS